MNKALNVVFALALVFSVASTSSALFESQSSTSRFGSLKAIQTVSAFYISIFDLTFHRLKVLSSEDNFSTPSLFKWRMRPLSRTSLPSWLRSEQIWWHNKKPMTNYRLRENLTVRPPSLISREGSRRPVITLVPPSRPSVNSGTKLLIINYWSLTTNHKLSLSTGISRPVKLIDRLTLSSSLLVSKELNKLWKLFKWSFPSLSL